MILLIVTGRPQANHAKEEVNLPEINVLLLSSWADHLPWAQGVMEGVSEEIKAIQQSTDRNVVLFVEYLDRSRIGTAISDEDWADFLRQKYQNIKIDAVIVDSEPAATLVLDWGESWFANIPLVLYTEQRANEDWLYTANLSLGEVMEQTVDLALQQNSEAKTVVIIGDQLPISLKLQQSLTAILAKVAPQLNVVVQDQFRLEDLEQWVSQLDDETVILYTLVFGDETGRSFRSADVVERLAAVASAPIYVMYDAVIGSGAIGGHVQSARNTGRQSIRAAFQLLDLAKTEDQAYLEFTVSQTMFDDRALRKWRIPRSSIPKNAEILHQRPSLWKNYFWESIATITFIVLLGGSLMITLILLRQRRQLSQNLLQVNLDLESRVAQRTEALHRLATRDDLTGIANRKEFYRCAQLVWEQFQADHQIFTFAILDIDHFKSINDTYGHPSGDVVLREFAQAIQRMIRDSDVLGRIGGEEFALLMPDMNLDGAIAALDKVRHHIENLNITLPDSRVVQITVSIGVAESSPEFHDLATMIQQADQFLYAAKRQGRNRVVAA